MFKCESFHLWKVAGDEKFSSMNSKGKSNIRLPFFIVYYISSLNILVSPTDKVVNTTIFLYL
jgi:hypothetical protein